MLSWLMEKIGYISIANSCAIIQDIESRNYYPEKKEIYFESFIWSIRDAFHYMGEDMQKKYTISYSSNDLVLTNENKEILILIGSLIPDLVRRDLLEINRRSNMNSTLAGKIKRHDVLFPLLDFSAKYWINLYWVILSEYNINKAVNIIIQRESIDREQSAEFDVINQG